MASPVSSSSTSITSGYFTGFGFLATERPVGVVANTAGDLAVFVPEFEVERTRAESTFERVESYPEYPGTEHPMRILGRVLADMGVSGAFGADSDGYPGDPRVPGAAAERGDGRRVHGSGLRSS